MYESKDHAKYSLVVHLVFVVKYRYPLLIKLGKEVKKLIFKACKKYGYNLILCDDTNHIHMLLNYKPIDSIILIAKSSFISPPKRSDFSEPDFIKEENFMRKYSKSIACLLVGLALYAGIESTYADPDLSKPVLSKTAVVKELTEADKEELVPKKDNDIYIIERSSKEERIEAEKNKEKPSSRSVMFFSTPNKTKQDFTAPTPVINNVSAKDAFYQIVAEKGLSESEINGWAYIINRESSWRVNAKNPSSGAYGLPQALPGNKMASHGADWQTNPYTQLRWMYDYMIGRYGSIQGAVNFWNKNHWY